MSYPDRLHFRYVRESCPAWFPDCTEDQARAALYQETEELRAWYQDMIEKKHDPPYSRAAHGYVAVYMPRGYSWFTSVVTQTRHSRLRHLVLSANAVLVVGCGPAPELYSLARVLASDAVVTLVDEEMPVWKPLIRGFTVPLVRESLGLLGIVHKISRVKIQQGTHGSVRGSFDLVIAQQVLNEIAVRPPSLNKGEDWPLSAIGTIRAWRAGLVRPGGAIVVVDNDRRDRRLSRIENSFPPGACERGDLSPGPVSGARDLAAWLSGSWGCCKPRPSARTKYLVIYS